MSQLLADAVIEDMRYDHRTASMTVEHARENDMQNSPPATPPALCEVQRGGRDHRQSPYPLSLWSLKVPSSPALCGE